MRREILLASHILAEAEHIFMRSLSGKQFELRLELTPQELRRLGANPALACLTVGKPVTQTLRSIYFDTPDHRLRAHGISLRLASIGDRWVQTIEAGPSLKNSVFNSDELDTVLRQPEPDLDAIDDRRVRRTIDRAIKASGLEPQFETVIKRTTRSLRLDKGELELALDEGVVRAGTAEDQLCAAGLALKAGSPDGLIEAAAALFAAQPIRLAEASDADRGYDLALGRQGRSSAPQRAEHPALSGDETCARALALFVESAAHQIEFNRRALLETEDPEAPHQLRVGLRRLRSALRAFRPLDDSPATRKLRQYARELAQSVGELRNADVFILSVHAPVARAKKGEPGFSELRKALLSHRAAKRAGARAALRGEQWSRLQLYLLLWPRTVKDRARLRAPVRAFAATALTRTWKRIARQGANLDRLSPDQRHDMRKALKELRYMSEFFASLYDARRVQRFVKDLKKLQDVFGYINDVSTAKALNAICDEHCADSRAAQRAAGYVLGWHEVKADQAWDGVDELWTRLKRRRRFWV